MEINIADSVAPCFDNVFRKIHDHSHTHYWLKGGRGSTKSSFISTQIPLILIRNPECHAVILRKVANTLKNSVYQQMQWGIEQIGLTSHFKFKMSPLEITYKKTGQKILFFGVDDKTKIKSIKMPFGYTGIVWYEELDQFSGMEEIRNLNQSLMRGGKKFWCFSSFNPPKSRDNWVNSEQLIDDADRLISHTTYLQVVREWLGEQFFLEAEKLKNTREELYKHEYLGEVTGTGGSVFDNIEEHVITDEEIEQFDRLKHGIDFGFAVDPFAFISAHFDKKHEILYIFDEVYQQKLSNKQAYEKTKDKVARRKVTADSSEPKSIAEMRGLGLNINGARKGPDSVEYGMKWLQGLSKIVIDKHRCPNTYKEFVNYEYTQNKEGEFISDYPDKNNHAIDACRYMCEDEMRQKRFSFD